MKKILTILAVMMACLSATPAMATYFLNRADYAWNLNLTVCGYSDGRVATYRFFKGNRPWRCKPSVEHWLPWWWQYEVNY